MPHIPMRTGLVRSRSAAMTLKGVSRPVAGFSGEGTPSIVISNRVESASTVMRWVLRSTAGSAQISIYMTRWNEDGGGTVTYVLE